MVKKEVSTVFIKKIKHIKIISFILLAVFIFTTFNLTFLNFALPFYKTVSYSNDQPYTYLYITNGIIGDIPVNVLRQVLNELSLRNPTNRLYNQETIQFKIMADEIISFYSAYLCLFFYVIVILLQNIIWQNLKDGKK